MSNEQIKYSIGIIGIGVLGNALKETFENNINCNIICYDKYKFIGNSILDVCKCDIIFICLPTEFDNQKNEYDKSEIDSVFCDLATYEYKGIIILKSTVEPKTTDKISQYYSYASLKIVHNPEFLSAKTATKDFKTQKHIVLGFPENAIAKEETIIYLKNFFSILFSSAKISICTSDESESMKIFCNSFYATKIQFFTEIKLLCDKLSIKYDNVKDLMLSNKWINPMHTNIPGHDGEISFGGKCFPKDIQALNEVFKKHDVPNKVIDAVVNENKMMRNT